MKKLRVSKKEIWEEFNLSKKELIIFLKGLLKWKNTAKGEYLKDINFLVNKLPKKFKTITEPIYKGIVLSKEDAIKLGQGKLRLKNPNFDSWSKKVATAREFARNFSPKRIGTVFFLEKAKIFLDIVGVFRVSGVKEFIWENSLESYGEDYFIGEFEVVLKGKSITDKDIFGIVDGYELIESKGEFIQLIEGGTLKNG